MYFDHLEKMLKLFSLCICNMGILTSILCRTHDLQDLIATSPSQSLSAQEASVPTSYVLGHNRFFLFSLALQVQVPFPHCRMFFPLFMAVMNSQVISLRKALESLESFPLPIESCRLSTYFAELLIFFLVCLSFQIVGSLILSSEFQFFVLWSSRVFIPFRLKLMNRQITEKEI